MKQVCISLVALLMMASCNPPAATEAPKEDAGAKALANYKKLTDHIMAQQFDSAYVMMAPDAVDHPTGWPEIHGRDSIIAMVKMWAGSSSDMKMEVLHATSDGEYVMSHYRITGTAAPNAMGMPCKGGAFDYTSIEMVRMNADGLMTDHWDYPDFGTFATQVGMDMAAMTAMTSAATAPAEKK